MKNYPLVRILIVGLLGVTSIHSKLGSEPMDVIGVTEHEIIQSLGPPNSSMNVGSRKILIYHDGAKVELLDGRVIDCHQSLRQRFREAQHEATETSPPNPDNGDSSAPQVSESLDTTIDTELRLLDQLSETLEGMEGGASCENRQTTEDLSQLLNSLDKRLAYFFILHGTGYFIVFVSHIWLIIKAFRTNSVWGLAVLFVPFANIKYLVNHWDSAKATFFLMLIGVAVGASSLLVINTL